jgi:hypothetical protein
MIFRHATRRSGKEELAADCLFCGQDESSEIQRGATLIIGRGRDNDYPRDRGDFRLLAVGIPARVVKPSAWLRMKCNLKFISARWNIRDTKTAGVVAKCPEGLRAFVGLCPAVDRIDKRFGG